MTFSDRLREARRSTGSIVCMGMDPDLERIGKLREFEHGDAYHKLFLFYRKIMDAAVSEDTMPGMLKPNYAFWGQYGIDGLRALKQTIRDAHDRGFLVIFDGKRGDIGKTSEAYAKEVFDFWDADATTVAPYMGSDSTLPFINHANRNGKGVYVLVRTSNKGAADFQDLLVSGRKDGPRVDHDSEVPLYMRTALEVAKWGRDTPGTVGAVVGATSLKELEHVAYVFYETTRDVPLLIPGVGAQGGSARDVAMILQEQHYEPAMIRINSSGGINFAFEKENTADFAGAAIREIRRLNKEIEEVGGGFGS